MAQLPGAIIKAEIAQPSCRCFWATLAFLITFYRTFPPAGPVLKRMLERAVGRVGKITNLEMGKDLDGRRKPFFTITLWYRRRGVGLKSENFYLKPSQIEVLPDRRRKQKDK